MFPRNFCVLLQIEFNTVSVYEVCIKVLPIFPKIVERNRHFKSKTDSEVRADFITTN